ncbi:MAG: hypothetical protein QOH93_3152 [Chloroflexia bacterium]|jgi:hypothetical protein|nr:hypothetical protein [Chloroflexia bacterium]
MNATKSPYLANDWRLADVVAALQLLSSYKWASRRVEDWAETLGKPLSGKSWEEIFTNHPEFFRLNDKGWASLRWRHAYDRNYHVERGVELTPDELSEMSEGEKDEALSRKALSADQTEALIKTAIDLHSRAVATQQEARWWIPVAAIGASFVGGVVGAILGAVLR